MTPLAQRGANTTLSSTGKETEPYRGTPTPAPQPQSTAILSEVQHVLTTLGKGYNELPPRKGTPDTGTDEGVEPQIQEYVIERVVGSE